MKAERVSAVILAAFLCMGCITPIYASQIPDQKEKLEQDKEKAQSEKQKIDNSLGQIKNKIGELNGKKKSVADSVAQLDAQMGELTGKLEVLETELSEKAVEIEQLTIQLQGAEEQQEQQYNDMKKRIQYMYERGKQSLVDALFSSTSMVDFLNKTEYVTRISEYDREMLAKYQEIQALIARTQENLQNEYSASEKLREQADRQQTSVESLIAQKNGEMADYQNQITDGEAAAADMSLEMEAQDDILAAIAAAQTEIEAAEAKAAKEAARKEAAEKAAKEKIQKEREAAEKAESDSSDQSQNGGQENSAADEKPEEDNSSGTQSGWTWPCPASTRITSDFGNRNSPTAGASSNHKGIDIGAATGSKIVAANSGTVVISTYSNSAGNYVGISHGNGLVSVYMHMSSRSVSVGDSVSAGEKIGAVGSTGYSTGPHLHFGVSVSGKYVSPWNYVG